MNIYIYIYIYIYKYVSGTIMYIRLGHIHTSAEMNTAFWYSNICLTNIRLLTDHKLFQLFLKY